MGMLGGVGGSGGADGGVSGGGEGGGGEGGGDGGGSQRVPQSMQSVAISHTLYCASGPPSSHSTSLLYGHVFSHAPGGEGGGDGGGDGGEGGCGEGGTNGGGKDGGSATILAALGPTPGCPRQRGAKGRPAGAGAAFAASGFVPKRA